MLRMRAARSSSSSLAWMNLRAAVRRGTRCYDLRICEISQLRKDANQRPAYTHRRDACATDPLPRVPRSLVAQASGLWLCRRCVAWGSHKSGGIGLWPVAVPERRPYGRSPDPSQRAGTRACPYSGMLAQASLACGSGDYLTLPRGLKLLRNCSMAWRTLAGSPYAPESIALSMSSGNSPGWGGASSLSLWI